MKRRRAAAPYAKAFFALAKERDKTELIGRELGDAAVTFESVADLRDFFARPWIPATAKRSVATEVAQRSDHSKALGGRQVVLEEIVESGSDVLDGSLEGQLDRMRRRLASH